MIQPSRNSTVFRKPTKISSLTWERRIHNGDGFGVCRLCAFGHVGSGTGCGPLPYGRGHGVAREGLEASSANDPRLLRNPEDFSFGMTKF